MDLENLTKKIEQRLNTDITDFSSTDATLQAKVAAQKRALGISNTGTQYAVNIGAGDFERNEVFPKNPFGEGMSLQGKNKPTANGGKVWTYLISKSITPIGAAGIMGNLMQESSPDINPKLIQAGGGPGRGIMQWTVSERWADLVKWANKQAKDPWDLYTQLDWMLLEMQSYKYKGRPVIDYFKAVDDIRDATLVFEKVMERAGKPMMENRYKYAADVLATYGPFKGRSLRYWGEKYG